MLNRKEISQCYDIDTLLIEIKTVKDEIRWRRAAADKEFDNESYLQASEDLRRTADLMANLGWLEDRVKSLRRCMGL